MVLLGLHKTFWGTAKKCEKKKKNEQRKKKKKKKKKKKMVSQEFNYVGLQ